VLVKKVSDTFILHVSAYHLLIIGADRYIAITRPLHYHQILSPRRVKIMITLAWCVPTLIHMTYFFWLIANQDKNCRTEDIVPDAYELGMDFTSFCLAGLVLIIMYSKIWVIARNHATKHAKRDIQLSIVSTQSTEQVPHKTRKWNIHHMKAFKMITIIILAYLISWAPYFIVAWYSMFSVTFSVPLFVAFYVCGEIGQCNSFVNLFMHGQAKILDLHIRNY
jgi:hypothetical protein